jgi:hypothetical protein
MYLDMTLVKSEIQRKQSRIGILRTGQYEEEYLQVPCALSGVAPAASATVKFWNAILKQG